MNDKYRKVINKLNSDNQHLNDAHKSMIGYSKGMILIGILFVLLLLILYI